MTTDNLFGEIAEPKPIKQHKGRTYTKDDRKGGFYWVEQKPYLSVTETLSVIAKPALIPWAVKTSYYFHISHPEASEQEVLASPYAESDRAKQRGTTVHSIVEAFKHTRQEIESLPTSPINLRGYGIGLYEWAKDTNVEILEHEKTVRSDEYRYAGTLDMLVKFKNSGRTCIVDVKTGKDIYMEAYIQLAAYKQALIEEGIYVDEVAVLLLSDSGKYRFELGEPDLKAFLAAKYLWLKMNQEKAIKCGYLGK
jgi:hypothetical protein